MYFCNLNFLKKIPFFNSQQNLHAHQASDGQNLKALLENLLASGYQSGISLHTAVHVKVNVLCMHTTC